MCGDSANEADVARLVATESATLMVTDPPYGVDYQGGAAGKRRRIANDDLGGDQSRFWTSALQHWPLAGDAYVFSPSGPLISVLCASIQAAGIEHHQWLIWVKDRLVLGHSNYHYRHEHVFYGWRGKTSWQGSRKEDSVWEEERPQASPQHPTMKPVALCVRAIREQQRSRRRRGGAVPGLGDDADRGGADGASLLRDGDRPPLLPRGDRPLGGVQW
jgi:DNA modification methylase